MTITMNNEEVKEFEQRRKAAWQSVYQGDAACEGTYPIKKKEKLTVAERAQQMKGLSKAFVNPGSGWAKVDPVHVEDDSEDKSDMSSEGEDLVALMRAKTKQIQQEKVKDQMSTPPPSNNTSEQFHSQRKDQPISTTAKISYITKPTNLHQVEIQLLNRILQVSQAKGMDAAWEWVRDQVIESGVSDPLKQTPKTPPPNSLSSLSLPAPLRMIPFNTPKAVEQERQYYVFFHDAAQYTPYEYTSLSNILFVVRRPYGLASRPGLFERISEHPNDHYKRGAHVSTLASLEVAVVLKPNFAALLIYGDQSLRYRSSPQQNSFQVGDKTMQLGTLDYSDASGNAVFHSLNVLAQQAFNIRQQYAVTMTSIAMSLVKTKSMSNSGTKTAPTVDVGVDTSDFVLVETKTVATNTTSLPLIQNYPSILHFTWWIRKKLPTIIPRYGREWMVLGLVMIIAGIFYWISIDRFLVSDPPMRQRIMDKPKRELSWG